jgi:hypothetical protein
MHPENVVPRLGYLEHRLEATPDYNLQSTFQNIEIRLEKDRSRSIRSQEQTLYAWTEKRSKEASVWDQTFRIGIWRLSRVERRETELHCALARLPKAVVDFVANRLDGRL